jgi:hypothetical protein
MRAAKDENYVGLNDFEILLRRAYLFWKPVIPERLQIFLRRNYVFRKLSRCNSIWPIDERAKLPPQGWVGWPDGKRFALVLTHDIETQKGQEKCIQLAEVEEGLGFKSSFNFTAKQYEVSREVQAWLRSKCFEVGLHGLYHDGDLFRNRKTFEAQVMEMNRCLRDWGAVGFRCPSMYHNLDWIGELNIEYDSSTFDTDPFEPQPDGVGTIFPFRVRRVSGGRDYLELPYTLPQDHTLFVIMQEKSINIWKKKLDWIADHRGMALLITHPDYMDFRGNGNTSGKYPVRYYIEFLEYLNSKYQGKYWHVLPQDVVHFWETSTAK